MANLDAVLPGDRVRAGDTVVGTIERIEAQDNSVAGGLADGAQRTPDHLIVRGEDGEQRYRIPVMLVSGVSVEIFKTVVRLDLSEGDLAHYATERTPDDAPPTQSKASASVRTYAPLSNGEWQGSGDDELVVPLVAEELTVAKQAAPHARVLVHKTTETFPYTSSVTTYREEATVEHLTPDQFDANKPLQPNETIIPVTEEQLVVEKRMVVSEYIRIRKNRVSEDRTVGDVVRREYLEVTEQRPEGAPTDGPDLLFARGAGTETTSR